MLRRIYQYFGKNKLHKAAQLGNLPRMRKLIEAGADVNERGPEGATPLFFTASCGSIPAAKMLLEHGADVNSAVNEGGTALHSALLKRDADLALFLIDNGADIHKATVAAVTPLHIAALGGLVPIMGRLLREGADPHALTTQGQGLIYCAMAGMTLHHTDDPAALRLLFAAGADPRDGIGTLRENMDGFSDGARAALRKELDDMAATDANEELRAFATQLLGEMDGSTQSPVLGVLTRSDDEDFQDWWYSEPMAVPFWENREIPFVYVFEPDADTDFIRMADASVKNFLKLSNEDRLSLTPFLRNNRDAACGTTASDGDDAVWKAVTPPDLIQVQRRHCRDKDIYLQMGLDCEWEEENGVQLVFRRGQTLTRVSTQDGWLTDADALTMLDEDDTMLARFSKKSPKP